jgi:hypothetical protein
VSLDAACLVAREHVEGLGGGTEAQAVAVVELVHAGLAFLGGDHDDSVGTAAAVMAVAEASLEHVYRLVSWG